MNEQLPQQPNQDLNIAGSVLEGVQIGGIAGRDMTLTQIQGGVHVTNVFGAVQVDRDDTQAGKPLSRQEYRWRQVLLEKVKRFWIDGVLAKSLHTKLFIELGLEERNDFIQNPLSEVQEFSTDLGQTFQAGTTATDIFDDIGAGRTLLILGEPGSGKTVTLLKLAESLIARTENDLSQPLPVIVNLSSWAKQRQAIAEWLVQELHEIYGASKSLGKTWVDQEQLILLLDGLDEVEPQYRNDCVVALNQFIQEHGLTEMVVCSRIHDYENLSERLKLRSAIYVQPLTSQQIDQTLEQSGESLSALRMAFQKNAELRAFASSPLILSIMSLAYQNKSTTEFLNQADTPEAQRKQLFDAYIERMFTRRGTTRTYSRKQTLYWLTWLAQQMTSASQSVFLIERLQPSWLISRHQRMRYRLVSALTFGLIFGLIMGLICTFNGLIYALLGILYGVVGALFIGFSSNIEPVETLKWSWREARKSFRKGLIVTVTGGLIAGFPVGFILGLIEDLEIELQYELLEQLLEGLYVGLVVGLIFMLMGVFFGVIYGLVFGLIGGFRGPAIQHSNIANQGMWKSAKNGLIVGRSVGLALVLIIGLLSGAFGGLVNGLKFGLTYGLAFGLIGGLMCGGSACFRHFILRRFLYRQGNIPWKYARFLDYTADRLFMQKVGGGYIFVHRMLMEHFAQMKLENESKAT